MASNNAARIDALEHQFEEILLGQEALFKSHSEIVSLLDGIEDRITLQIVEALKELNQGKVKDTAPYGTTSTVQFNGKFSELLNVSDRLPEFDFPKFTGDNAIVWVRKCNRYFLFNPMSDYEKIMIAGLNMEGVADDWYLDYVDGKENMTMWEEFCGLLLNRFQNGEGSNLVGRFNKLKQLSSVSEYIKEFEELKAFMVTMYRSLPEDYYIKSFISGLKEEVGQMVEIFSPGSLLMAMKLAIRQEHLLLVMNKGHKLKQEEGSKGMPSTYQEEKAISIKRLTPAELELRKKKNLCFNCDETYHIRHKCKKLFVIMMEDAEPKEDLELVETTNGNGHEEPLIFLSVLTGPRTSDTMKLSAKVGEQSLAIILSSGSTHSFLDPNAAKRVGCEVEYTNPVLVTVANGRKIECNSKCSKLELELGDCKLSTPVRILKLGVCDMVIGADLLSQLGPISFDFKNHKVQFSRNGVRYTIHHL